MADSSLRPLPFPVEEFVADQLWGIPMQVVDANGNLVTYPNSAIERHIRASVNTLERRLQMDLWPRRVVTRGAVVYPTLRLGYDYDIDDDPMDYDASDYFANGYIRLRRYPVLSVSKVELRFPADTSILVYPADWLRVNRRAGQINVVVINSQTQPALVGREGGYLPLLTGGLLRASFPQLIYVDYTTGIFDPADPQSRDNFEDFYLAIKQQAAATVLLDLGRAIKPGLTSYSLSQDGQSESASLARSKGSIYGSEIDALQASVDAFVMSAKAAMKGPIFCVL